MRKFNEWLALRITSTVGTMWCFYVFALLACVSLPAALATHDKIVIVSWIAQTFLQLVLLPALMVGQNIQGKQNDRLHETILAHVDLTLEIERRQDARHASALAANNSPLHD